MTSQLFIDYINDDNNLKSSYDFDINCIIIDRVLNKTKENIYSSKNVKVELKQKENNQDCQFKYYENNIGKIRNSSKVKKDSINTKEYNTVNKDKCFETLINEKNSSGKKSIIREGKNNIKTKNLMTLYHSKKQIYKKKDNNKIKCNQKNVKSNRDNDIIINNNNLKNMSNRKYATLTETNIKNISQRNDDISLDNNNKKKRPY